MVFLPGMGFITNRALPFACGFDAVPIAAELTHFARFEVDAYVKAAAFAALG